MAAAVQVTGPAEIQVGTGAAGALEKFGYTRNGAEIVSEGYWINVPGDENGGDEGPPIDVQFIGETARIRVELTKWDTTAAAEVESRFVGGTGGVPGAAGTLMFSGSKAMRLLVKPTTGARNFPRAFPRFAIEVNKGTRFSTLVVEFEAHKDATGVLWNTSIVGAAA